MLEGFAGVGFIITFSLPDAAFMAVAANFSVPPPKAAIFSSSLDDSLSAIVSSVAASVPAIAIATPLPGVPMFRFYFLFIKITQ